MVLHDIFLQVMSSNWQEYIEDLRSEIAEIVSRFQSIKPKRLLVDNISGR